MIYTSVAILLCLSVLIILFILLCRKYRQRNQKLDINKTWIIEWVLNYSKGHDRHGKLCLSLFTLYCCVCRSRSPEPGPRLWLRTPGSGSAQFSSWRGKMRWEAGISSYAYLQIFNKDDHCATRRIIFTYPMIAYTDMEDSVKAEVMEIATNACEKFLNDNQSVNN